ncbi:MAG: hypothetical protein AB7G93_07365 [Bdellovibrionales bacterium]
MIRTLILFAVITVFFMGCTKLQPFAGGGGEAAQERPFDTPIPLVKINHVARLGDRYFVKSVLESIFLSPEGNHESDPKIRNIIERQVFASSLFFGGACHVHDIDCRTGSRSDEISTIVPSSNPSREGLRNMACRYLVQVDQAIHNALGRAGVNLQAEIDDEKIKAVVKLFYPSVEFPLTGLQALKSLSEHMSPTSTFEAWRFVVFTICLTPGWQIP